MTTTLMQSSKSQRRSHVCPSATALLNLLSPMTATTRIVVKIAAIGIITLLLMKSRLSRMSKPSCPGSHASGLTQLSTLYPRMVMIPTAKNSTVQ